MARLPRIKHDDGGSYHVFNRLAGACDFYAFNDPRVRRYFLRRLFHYLRSYSCELTSFTLMDNHYHLILLMMHFRRLARKQLEARARLLYGEGKWRRYTAHWSDSEWERFNRRLFDLSDLIARLQSDFTRWFNRTFNRRGSAWAGRFGSTCLTSQGAIVEVLFYVELNPVRAGLVRKPEDWTFGSARRRLLGRDGRLKPLTELFPDVEPHRVFQVYRRELLYRGRPPTRRHQVTVSPTVFERERRRGFQHPGCYLQRRPFFSNGLILGDSEPIQEVLDDFHARKLYRRRRQPVPHLGGRLFSLRRAAPHRHNLESGNRFSSK